MQSLIDTEMMKCRVIGMEIYQSASDTIRICGEDKSAFVTYNQLGDKVIHKYSDVSAVTLPSGVRVENEKHLVYIGKREDGTICAITAKGIDFVSEVAIIRAHFDKLFFISKDSDRKVNEDGACESELLGTIFYVKDTETEPYSLAPFGKVLYYNLFTHMSKDIGQLIYALDERLLHGGKKVSNLGDMICGIYKLKQRLKGMAIIPEYRSGHIKIANAAQFLIKEVYGSNRAEILVVIEFICHRKDGQHTGHNNRKAIHIFKITENGDLKTKYIIK